MGMTLKDRWGKGKEAAKALKSASRGDRAAEKLGEEWGVSSAYVRQYKRLFESFDSYETMIAEITKEFGTVDVSWRKVLHELVIDGSEYADKETFLYIMEFLKSYKIGISKDVETRSKALEKQNNGLEEFIRLIKKYPFPDREKAQKAENRCKKAILAMGYVKNDHVSKEVCKKDVNVIWVVDRCIEIHRTQGKLEREAGGEVTIEPTNE
jgi:hypothetical protein